MNCITCGEEFKPKHKYHEFCTRRCAMKNYFSKDRVITPKTLAPKKVKKKSEFFDWKDYPHTVII